VMTLPYEARIHTSSSYLIEHSRDFHGWIEDGRALLGYDLEFICDTIDNAVDSRFVPFVVSHSRDARRGLSK
jgi:hypothetical protein